MIVHTLKGLGQLQQYTPAQLAAMSQADLRAIVTNAQSEIDYINQQLLNENISEETKAGMRANILQYQALVAAITAWLQLSQSQQAHTNGENFISQHQQQYISSYQNVSQNIAQNYGSGFMNVLSQNIAGLPTWLWIGIIAGGIYFVAK